jgi:hypothetical protein
LADDLMVLLADPRDGDALDASETMYPARLQAHRHGCSFSRPTSTTYGYVVSGHARISASIFDVTGRAGTYFAIPGDFEIDVDGQVVTIERMGFRGVAQAGAIERRGRLTYIDGCSDTVLVAPPRLGDPVLNHLHFPAGIVQTVHCHPSIRLGVVARGSGTAFGPSARGGWESPLAPGAVFLLPSQVRHAFRTDAGEAMDIIAFHPDSDWGPTDDNHPMLNRTYAKDKANRTH